MNETKSIAIKSPKMGVNCFTSGSFTSPLNISSQSYESTKTTGSDEGSELIPSKPALQLPEMSKSSPINVTKKSNSIEEIDVICIKGSSTGSSKRWSANNPFGWLKYKRKKFPLYVAKRYRQISVFNFDELFLGPVQKIRKLARTMSPNIKDFEAIAVARSTTNRAFEALQLFSINANGTRDVFYRDAAILDDNGDHNRAADSSNSNDKVVGSSTYPCAFDTRSLPVSIPNESAMSEHRVDKRGLMSELPSSLPNGSGKSEGTGSEPLDNNEKNGRSFSEEDMFELDCFDTEEENEPSQDTGAKSSNVEARGSEACNFESSTVEIRQVDTGQVETRTIQESTTSALPVSQTQATATIVPTCDYDCDYYMDESSILFENDIANDQSSEFVENQSSKFVENQPSEEQERILMASCATQSSDVGPSRVEFKSQPIKIPKRPQVSRTNSDTESSANDEPSIICALGNAVRFGKQILPEAKQTLRKSARQKSLKGAAKRGVRKIYSEESLRSLAAIDALSHATVNIGKKRGCRGIFCKAKQKRKLTELSPDTFGGSSKTAWQYNTKKIDKLSVKMLNFVQKEAVLYFHKDAMILLRYTSHVTSILGVWYQRDELLDEYSTADYVLRSTLRAQFKDRKRLFLSYADGTFSLLFPGHSLLIKENDSVFCPVAPFLPTFSFYFFSQELTRFPIKFALCSSSVEQSVRNFVNDKYGFTHASWILETNEFLPELREIMESPTPYKKPAFTYDSHGAKREFVFPVDSIKAPAISASGFSEAEVVSQVPNFPDEASPYTSSITTLIMLGVLVVIFVALYPAMYLLYRFRKLKNSQLRRTSLA